MGNVVDFVSERHAEADTIWEFIPDELLVHVLSFLPAKEVATAATVIFNLKDQICNHSTTIGIDAEI